MARRGSVRTPYPHLMVASTVDGYFVCSCGCGFVAVCFHCFPQLVGKVEQWYCRAEQKRLKIWDYAEPVESRGGDL